MFFEEVDHCVEVARVAGQSIQSEEDDAVKGVFLLLDAFKD